jgi:hypothetical protein
MEGAAPVAMGGANHADSIHNNHYNIENGWKEKAKEVLSRIWDIVVVILKAIALGILLFCNPTIFALSFAVGAIWDEEAQRIVEKIEHLVTSQKLFSGVCLFAGAFIALPVTLAAVTIYAGLRLGLYMNSEEKPRDGGLLVVSQDKQDLMEKGQAPV